MRSLLLAAIVAMVSMAAAPPPPALSAQDQALATQGLDYLQALTSAHARFVQVDPRGQVSGGELWLKRPGKVRFQYDPPSSIVIASDGRLVSILNPRLKTFTNYPLSLTPLSILLAGRIRIGHGVTVTAVRQTPQGFSVTAMESRQKGTLILDFRRQPLALTGWTVVNPQGGQTRVSLAGLKSGGEFDAKLFDLRRPAEPAT